MLNDFKSVISKSLSGLASLSIRSAFINAFQIISSYLLARYLSPEDYGQFGILMGWLGALVFFTDIGAGELLIVQKNNPTKKELGQYFGIRLFLTTICIVLFIGCLPHISSHYDFSFEHQEYLPLISLYLLLEVLMQLPKIAIEKDLDFKKIAKIEMISTLFLYISQISLAYLGFGVWSFFIALLIQKTLSTILAQIYNPTFVWPTFSFHIFKEVFKQGIFFQVASIIPNFKAIIMPYVLSFFLSVEQIGLIFWVTRLVSFPMVFGQNYNQVFFPALAKVKDQIDQFSKLANQAISHMSFIMQYIFGVGAVCSYAIIHLLFPEKWHSSTTLFPAAVLAISFMSSKLLTYSIFTAQSNPNKRSLVEISSLLLEVLFIWFMTQTYSTVGYFYGLALAHISTFVLSLFQGRKVINSATLKRLFISYGAAISSFFIIYQLDWYKNVFLAGLTFSIIFMFFAFALDKSIIYDIKRIKKRLF